MVTAARQWFERFHAGASPSWRLERLEPPAWLADLGELVSVAYVRDTPRGREVREHVFAPASRPVLARDDRGALAVVGGSYNVREVGIVDSHKGLQHVPHHAALSHAPRGIALRTTPAGVPVHGRQTPREGAMVPRANPMSVQDLAHGAQRLGSAVTVGFGTLAGVYLSDMVVERTTLGEKGRAFAQFAALGVPGSIALMTGAHHAGAGAVSAAITGAGLRLFRAWGWDRMLAARLARWWGTMRPEERAGAGLWPEGAGADVRVEAVANG